MTMRKRIDFRRRKTNSSSKFHLFPGFAQPPRSHRPSSFRLRLNTFKSPSRSGMYAAPSTPLPAQYGATLYFIREQDSSSAAYQVLFFFEKHGTNPLCQAVARQTLNLRLRERSRKALPAFGEHGRPIQPIQLHYTKNLRRPPACPRQSLSDGGRRKSVKKSKCQSFKPAKAGQIFESCKVFKCLCGGGKQTHRPKAPSCTPAPPNRHGATDRRRTGRERTQPNSRRGREFASFQCATIHIKVGVF